MTPPRIRIFCPACGKWIKTNAPPGGLYFCPECQAEFPSDDNLANAQTFIGRLRADLEESRADWRDLADSSSGLNLALIDAQTKLKEAQAEIEKLTTRDVCTHDFIHIETCKVQGERQSYGMVNAVNWKRVDRFACRKCLHIEAITQEWPWIKFPKEPPEGW